MFGYAVALKSYLKKWRIYGLLFLEILALQNCEEFIRLHPHSRLL